MLDVDLRVHSAIVEACETDALCRLFASPSDPSPEGLVRCLDLAPIAYAGLRSLDRHHQSWRGAMTATHHNHTPIEEHIFRADFER